MSGAASAASIETLGRASAGRNSFAVAVALVVVVHSAFLYRSRSLAHVGRVIALPPAMVVRTVVAKPMATPHEREVSPAAGSMSAQAAAESHKSPASVIDAVRPGADAVVAKTAVAARGQREHVTAIPLPSSPSVAPTRAEGGAPERSSSAAQAPISPATTVLPAAPDYLLAAGLDPGPFPLDDINPEYPDSAQQRSGSVVLRLLISEAGHVDEVAVVRSAPPGLFERSALTAFGDAKFSPGKLFGAPVKSQITVEVEFTPLNRGARVSGRSY